MTFLELCQAYRAELGIPGNGPSSVTSQIGELARVVLDIQNAESDVNRRWADWKYLHTEFRSVTVVGATTLETPVPADIGTWDTNTVWLDKTLAQRFHMKYIDHDEFSNSIALGPLFNEVPTLFTELQDGSLKIWPAADQVYSLTADYWRRPAILSSNAEVSPIPEVYHRVIIVRAKMYYAEREDAPELMAGASTEFEDLMFQLEANQLRGQSVTNQSRAVRPNQMVIE